jgi:hypothetical protein
MNSPMSFKPYYGCFARLQGHLNTPENFNSGEWTEVVGKRGKQMRSKRFACSVALGPSNIQAGTNLRSTHAVVMSHVMSGNNQVQVPSTGSAYFGLGKRTATIRNGEKKTRRNFVKLGNRKNR